MPNKSGIVLKVYNAGKPLSWLHFPLFPQNNDYCRSTLCVALRG